MPTLNFDISSLFTQAFGIGRGKPYDGSKATVPGITQVDGYEAPTVDDEEGTEFVNMRDVVKASTPYGHSIFMPIRLGGVLLPNEPTVNVQMVNRIVKTSLTGSTRKGTVKELIGRDDDILTIRGICLNYGSVSVYPEDLVKAIRDLVVRKESLLIESALTTLLGIERVVIERCTFPEMMGVQHAQAYELQCVSDESFDLEI